MGNKRFIVYLKFNGLKVIENNKDIFIGVEREDSICNVGLIYNPTTKTIFIEEFREISLEDTMKICNIINSYNMVSGFYDETTVIKNPITKLMHKKTEMDKYEEPFEKFILENFDNKYRESKVKLVDGLFIDIRGLSIKNKIKFLIKKSDSLDDKTKKIYLYLADKKCK